jgi:TolA-binding protein
MKTTSPYPSSSSGAVGPPARLTELLASKSGNLSPLEQQAAELIAKLPAPAPLPGKSLERIGEAIQRPVASKAGFWIGGSAGLVAVVAAGLLFSYGKSRPTASQQLPLPVIEQLAAPPMSPLPPSAAPQIESTGGIAQVVPGPLPPIEPGRAPSRPAKKHAAAKPPAALPAEPMAPAVLPPIEESPLAIESRLIGQALFALRQQHDPKLAIQRLDDYAGRFPQGSLHDEAQAARVDALILLGKQREALAILEKTSFDRLPRGGELTVLRGELRAASGLCKAALSDFAHVEKSRTSSDVAERALYGQGVCRAHLGDLNGAAGDLRAYISRFPGGRFQSAAQATLRSLASSASATP